MPVCSIVKLIPRGTVNNLVHYSSTAPRSNSLDYTTNRHEITVHYFYMTGENPVTRLAEFVFINLNVYLKTGQNWPTGVH